MKLEEIEFCLEVMNERNVIGNSDGRELEYADLFKYVDSLQDSGFSALYKSGQQPVKLISG